MALVLKDRVKQSSITTGTGVFTLSAVFLGFQSFSDAIGNGNTTYYAIYHENNNEWEVGIGTVGAGTLTRNTVLASTNSNALVNFSVGNKVVFCDYPAEKAIYKDENGNLVVTGGIERPTFIDFDTTYTTPLTEGQLGWDGNNTLGLGMAGGNVIQHIGEDQFFYCKATSAITKGEVVMFTGAVGASGVPTGAPATGITDGTYIMGIAAENIANNAFGLVQAFGTLRNVNTNGFADGDILWYNPSVAGGMTNVKPSAPNVKVQMAAVIKGGSTGGGTILIRINAGSVLGGTDSNVQITSPTDGQQLVYNSGIWNNSNSPTISGGSINNTPIGSTTPNTGNFTTLSAQTATLRGTGQNLFTYSEQFDNAAWGKSNVTVVANDTTAPDGTLTADKIIPTAPSASFKELQQNFTSVQGLDYTFSCYVKQAGYQFIQLVGTNLSIGTFAINYDLSNGTETLFSAGTSTVLNRSITSVGNGWYRVSVTLVAIAAATSAARIGINIIPASNSGRGVAWASNGTDGIYQWGAQLEVSASLGSYIPTTATAIYGTPTLSFNGVADIGLQSNGALYLQPAGTGAIQSQAATSTAVGGNARGVNAVDWQTTRGSASQVASGFCSAIGGGGQNTASGTFSSVFGGVANLNSASYGGIFTGYSNTTSGILSFIGSGNSNSATGYFNFIGSGFGNLGTANAAVTTQATTSVTSGSTAVTLSGSNASIRVGQLVIGTGIPTYPHTYVAAISGTSLTLSQNANATGTPTLSFFTPHGVVVGGGNNQATGSYSFIGGGGDAGTAANRNTASGDWSVVCGGAANTASATGSFVGGGGISGGILGPNTASGTNSVVTGGFANTASGVGSLVSGGTQNVANSTRGSVLGGRYGNTRSINGIAVISACDVPIASASVSQSAILIIARQTTDATATILTSDTGAAGTTNQVILPNNSAYFFRGEVIAGVTGGGNTKGWTIEGVIKRGANAASTTLVGTPTVTSSFGDAGAAAWTVAVTADTTNGGLRLTVTGAAATTIRWVAQIRTTEMTF